VMQLETVCMALDQREDCRELVPLLAR
jgi:hypothetical protein